MASRKSGRGKVRAGSAKTTKRVADAYRIEEPTPELRARVAFDIATIKCEMGKVIGRAYRRRPLFETMRTAGALSLHRNDAGSVRSGSSREPLGGPGVVRNHDRRDGRKRAAGSWRAHAGRAKSR